MRCSRSVHSGCGRAEQSFSNPAGQVSWARDGALGMKFGWTRGIPGKLIVTGHRLDGPAGPLRLYAPCCYGDVGFQASHLIFPTAGCWEVMAQLGDREDSKLTFITKVVKIGDEILLEKLDAT